MGGRLGSLRRVPAWPWRWREHRRVAWALRGAVPRVVFSCESSSRVSAVLCAAAGWRILLATAFVIGRRATPEGPLLLGAPRCSAPNVSGGQKRRLC